jgi:hypothetical protein
LSCFAFFKYGHLKDFIPNGNDETRRWGLREALEFTDIYNLCSCTINCNSISLGKYTAFWGQLQLSDCIYNSKR